jgi:hypothetical protein
MAPSASVCFSSAFVDVGADRPITFAHRPWSVNCEGHVEAVERHVAIPAVLDMEDYTNIADSLGRPLDFDTRHGQTTLQLQFSK